MTGAQLTAGRRGRHRGLLRDLGAWWVCHHCPRCHLGRSLGVVLPCPSNPAARAKAMLSVSLFSRPLCCSATGVRVVVLSKRAWEWRRRCPLPWMNGYPGAFPFRTGTWVLHGGTPGISVPPDRDLLGWVWPLGGAQRGCWCGPCIQVPDSPRMTVAAPARVGAAARQGAGGNLPGPRL